MFKLPSITLISHPCKVILKIPQARLQQYMDWELLDVQLGFRKGRGNCQHQFDHRKNKGIPEKKKKICFIDHGKTFHCVDHNQLWKIPKEMGIQDHRTCILRNLYAGQEATVRTRHGMTNWFKIGKGLCQGYVLSLCLCNLLAVYIMQNSGLDESQAGIKIARRLIWLIHGDIWQTK